MVERSLQLASKATAKNPSEQSRLRISIPFGKVHPVPEVVVPLTVRDLVAADLPAVAWAGSGPEGALDRVGRGGVDYLVVYSPTGFALAAGGVDYTLVPGAGTLWQLSVHEAVRSCGIGTILIAAAEDRIRGRGLHRAELGVDDQLPRPRRLYERLGYVPYGSERGSWLQADPDGSSLLYETTITLLWKQL